MGRLKDQEGIDLDRLRYWKGEGKGRSELQTMLPRHFKILDLYLMGVDTRSIASRLNVSPRVVTMVIASPIFQEELSRRRKGVERDLDSEYSSGVRQAKKILDEAAAEAAQFHVDLVRNAQEETRLRQISAKEILDRVLGPESKNSATSVVMSIDQVNLLSVALKESRGELVEPNVIELKASGEDK